MGLPARPGPRPRDHTGPVADAAGAGGRRRRRATIRPRGGDRTWEKRSPPGRVRPFRMIPPFSSTRQDELTRSHVHRPPCAHMGARQLILTNPEEPQNLNETPHPPREGPPLPCATPPAHPPTRPQPRARCGTDPAEGPGASGSAPTARGVQSQGRAWGGPPGTSLRGRVSARMTLERPGPVRLGEILAIMRFSIRASASWPVNVILMDTHPARPALERGWTPAQPIATPSAPSRPAP